jgi:pilus assembly protein CpaE
MADFVIVDTRPSFDDVTMTLLDLSDRILLLLTLELTAIKGAKQYLELSDLLGYDSEKIQLVLNRATVNSGIPVEDVSGSLKGEIIAKLPDDPIAVLRAINEGVPIQQSAPNSGLAHEISNLAAFLTKPEREETSAEPTPISAAPAKGLSRWIRPGQKKKVG